MQKKWSVRTLLTLLCVVMLCSIPAYAVEARASERIMHSTATLSSKSNGDFSIFFSVRATGITGTADTTAGKTRGTAGSTWPTR